MPDTLERRLLTTVRRHGIEGRLPIAAWTAGLGQAEFDALAFAVGACESGLPLPSTVPIQPRPALLSPLVALLWSNREVDGHELGTPGLRAPRCGDCNELPVCFPDAPRIGRSEFEVDGTQTKQEPAARGQGLAVDHRRR